MTKTIRNQFSVTETDDSITRARRVWNGLFNDREDYERLSVLSQALNAWRNNPLARRIVEITTEFVLGDGFSFTCEAPSAARFLTGWWQNPLNDLDSQLPEWADEAWRTGDLFLLFSLDPSGASYVRALPSEMVTEIERRENDTRQETGYLTGSTVTGMRYPAFDPQQEQGSFVLHYPLNRAVGTAFGESDLTPILYWLNIYDQWLEARARINHARQHFSFVVKKPFENEAQKTAFTNKWNARPPRPGSVLVADPNEEWSVIAPQLASSEAGEDGLAIKRMIAAGVGMPLHFLAEPEASTRTTAESADMPTFKRFNRRQNYLRNVVTGVLRTALILESRSTPRLLRQSEINVEVPDISERDNATLALAVQRMVSAFAPLYNAKLIDPAEFIRLVYRFVAETPPEHIGGYAPVNVRGGGKAPAEPTPVE